MLYEVPCQLDAAGVRSCRESVEMLAGKPGDLVLDLIHVTKMDSSGLGLLVLLQKRKLANGHRFGIRNVTAEPFAILKQFDLLGVLGYIQPERPVTHAAGRPAVAA